VRIVKIDRMKKQLPLSLIFLLSFVLTAIAEELTYYQLSSLATPSQKMHAKNGAPVCGEVSQGQTDAEWIVIRKSTADGETVTLKNRKTGTCLRMKDSALSLGAASNGSSSHLWIAEQSPHNPVIYSLRNVATGDYLRFFAKDGRVGTGSEKRGTETLWTLDKL